MSAPQGRPKATAADVVRIVSTYDMREKIGKSEIWQLLGTLRRKEQPDGYRSTQDFCVRRDWYREIGIASGVAVRLAALDFAKHMPGAELLDPDVIDELRGPFRRLELEPQEV